jgi:hypothetical protein
VCGALLEAPDSRRSRATSPSTMRRRAPYEQARCRTDLHLTPVTILHFCLQLAHCKPARPSSAASVASSAPMRCSDAWYAALAAVHSLPMRTRSSASSLEKVPSCSGCWTSSGSPPGAGVGGGELLKAAAKGDGAQQRELARTCANLRELARTCANLREMPKKKIAGASNRHHGACIGRGVNTDRRMRRKLQKVSVLATVYQGAGLGCADAAVAFARSLALFHLGERRRDAPCAPPLASLLRRLRSAGERGGGNDGGPQWDSGLVSSLLRRNLT